MTQLTTIKINICPVLSKEENVLISAYSGTKVRVLSKKELASAINDSITKIYNYCRYSIPVDSDMKIMVDDMVKDISTYFSQVTIDEINLAFNKGARGEYGEFAGISNAVMFAWLQKYVSSAQRQLAIKKQAEYLNPKPIELTSQEKKKIIHDGCLLMFSEFKDKKFVLDIGNATYNYLDSIGIFQWAKGRKFEFLRQAQSQLIEEHKNVKDSMKDKIKRRDIQDALEGIKNTQSTEVVSRAKRIALNTYFSDLTEMGIELNEKMENK